MTVLPIDFTGHVFCYTASWGLRQDLAALGRHVGPEWAGRPMLYLQVGVGEGMVAVWMFQHVLTHPESRAVGVAFWSATAPSHTGGRRYSPAVAARTYARLTHNLAPWRDRCEVILAGQPGDVSLPGPVDLCFVDAGYSSEWLVPLLKPNGGLIVNDGRKIEGLERIWHDGRCDGYRVKTGPE